MMIDEQQPIVAFTLARYPLRYCVANLAHMGFDRWPLLRAPGLSFWRLLGVGQGRVFNPHADLQRFALFTVWQSFAALRQFEQRGAVMRRIRSLSEEMWTVYMRPVRWHGSWGGRDPFRGIAPVALDEQSPHIILTRATIRPTRLAAFLRAVPAVAEELLQHDALINSVGVGEMPLLRQATLSIWRSLPTMTEFAYGSQAHREVVRRTRSERWYSEELFARFRPLASIGTWDGINPLPELAP